MVNPLVFLLLFLPNIIPLTHSLTFNFSTFDINHQDKFILQGNATIAGGALELTNNKGTTLFNSMRMGRVSYREAVQLWDTVQGNTTRLFDFTTHFSFNIFKNRTSPSLIAGNGYGFAFFLVPKNDKWFADKSLDGGLLGLFNSMASAMDDTPNDQVVAVEFDTFEDHGWDPTKDHHIGIDVNSIISKNITSVFGGLVDRGVGYAMVTYNSTSKNFCAHLTFDGSPDPYDVCWVVDLSHVLPQRVQVGFSAVTDTLTPFETHQILSWSFNSNLNEVETSPSPADTSPNPKHPTQVGIFVAIGLASLFLIVLISVALLYYYRSWRKVRADETRFDDLGGKRFSYSQLSRATDNFSNERKLGAGGFGDVYEGLLTNPKVKVAVKKFRSGSNQGEKEYVSEIKIISRLRHRNIVPLIGWCHDHGELLLVYEFMPNRSLDFHLYEKDMLPTLPWPTRYHITLGLASALHYLHEEGDQCVIHRDIKSSNVMLDSNFNARLGDFGLARFTKHGQSLKTTIPAGTLGYLAPECIKSGKASKESDVFGFGVVALETVCGRRPIEPEEEDSSKASLVEWVVNLHASGFFLQAIDKRVLDLEFDEDQARRLMVVGLWCTRPNPSHRPTMKRAIAALNLEAPLPSLSLMMTTAMDDSPGTNVLPAYESFNIDVASRTT